MRLGRVGNTIEFHLFGRYQAVKLFSVASCEPGRYSLLLFRLPANRPRLPHLPSLRLRHPWRAVATPPGAAGDAPAVVAPR